MELLMVPLIGPFHFRSPAYNAASVVDVIGAWKPDVLFTTALAAGQLSSPDWQDTEEVALPLMVVPWTSRSKVPLQAVGAPPREPGAEEDFRRYLEGFPEGRRSLAAVDSLVDPVRELLARPLTLSLIREELVPALGAIFAAREEEFGDGPATGWLRERTRMAVERLLATAGERSALLVPVEQLPLLDELLTEAGVSPVWPAAPEPSKAARERALLDYALRMESPEPEPLLEKLEEVPGSEARYHQANILVALGRGPEALDLLEAVSRGDFSQPYFLPGYVLARLGQLRDLAGQREAALRAYRGVLALAFAPREALEAAQAGLEQPFG